MLPVRGGIYMISSPTANTTVQVGRDGVLVVDTQTAGLSDALLARNPQAVGQADPDDRQHDHRRRSHRRQCRAARSRDRSSPAATSATPRSTAPAARRSSPSKRAVAAGRQLVATPQAGRPTLISSRRRTCSSTASRCSSCTCRCAHSDGDSMVVFRRTDVISVGNIYTPGAIPSIDVERGGTIEGSSRR